MAKIKKIKLGTETYDLHDASALHLGDYITAGQKSGTQIGTCATAEGAETEASGDHAHAEGARTVASGNQSHAEGNRSEAKNDQAHAEGFDTRATGKQAHAEGDKSQATGDCSHAEGAGTVASGKYSHAEGAFTVAEGDNSHAQGKFTEAKGFSSFAGGYRTRSSHSHLVAFGHMNEDLEGNAFEIGRGVPYPVTEEEDSIDQYEDKALRLNAFEVSRRGQAKAAKFASKDIIFNDETAQVYPEPNPEDDDYESKKLDMVQGAIASGIQSVAFGGQRFDKRASQTAEGKTPGIPTEAKGIQSFAHGGGVVVDGPWSAGFGKDTKTYQRAAFVTGGGNTVGMTKEQYESGTYPIDPYEISQNTSYEGSNIFGAAFGESNIVTARDGFAAGSNNKVHGLYSDAMGKENTTRGESSFASGYKNTVEGKYAHVEGTRSKALGDQSHAEGYETTAEGDSAHAEGYKTHANGDAAHTEGEGTYAVKNAHAGGFESRAENLGSFAHGLRAYAKKDYQAVFGQYNADDSEALFIVGNGDLTTKNNAFTVNANGTATIATAPINNMDVTNKEYVNTYVNTAYDLGTEKNQENGNVKINLTNTNLNSTDSIVIKGVGSSSVTTDETGAIKVWSPTADNALSDASTNPVQNKVINTALAGKSDYFGHKFGAQSGTSYAKICTIALPIKTMGTQVEFEMVGRTGSRFQYVRCAVSKENTSSDKVTLYVSGHSGNIYNVSAYKYIDNTNGDHVEIWATIPSWDTLNIFKKSFAENGNTKNYTTWDLIKEAALPVESDSIVKVSATLENWSGTADKATKDGNGNNIVNTYATKGHTHAVSTQDVVTAIAPGSGSLTSNDTNTGIKYIQELSSTGASASGKAEAGSKTHTHTYAKPTSVSLGSNTTASGGIKYIEEVTHTPATLTGTKTFNTDAIKAVTLSGTGSSTDGPKYIDSITKGSGSLTSGDSGSIKYIEDVTHTAPSLTGDKTFVKAQGTFSQGTLPSLTITSKTVSNITGWSAGTLPSLTTTPKAPSKISNWNAGTMFNASYNNGVLKLTAGTAPSLSFTEEAINSLEDWSAGSLPNLTYTPNISIGSASGWSAGTLPSLGNATNGTVGINGGSITKTTKYLTHSHTATDATTKYMKATGVAANTASVEISGGSVDKTTKYFHPSVTTEIANTGTPSDTTEFVTGVTGGTTTATTKYLQHTHAGASVENTVAAVTEVKTVSN